LEQVILGGYYDLLSPADVEYNSVVGGMSWRATETDYAKPVSTDGYIKSLRVVLSGAPGVGTHYDFTLMLNGAPTALTVEIADLDVDGSDMITSIDVTGADLISLKSSPDSTPNAVYAKWSFIFEGDTPNESIILGGSWAPLHDTNTEYSGPMGAYIAPTGTENVKRQVMPTAGVLKNFYVSLSADPGTAPDAYRLTVRLNKTTVAQSLIVTIVANDKTGSDLAHNLVVTAGDILTVMCEPLNTPLVEPFAQWGMTFVADIDGESVVLGNHGITLDVINTEYNYLVGFDGDDWIANEAQRSQLAQSCWVTKLHILLSGTPGAGNRYDFRIRKSLADTLVTVRVSDPATTGDSGILIDTLALDEYVDFEADPGSTPDARFVYWGFVLSDRAYGWSGKISGVTDPAEIAGVAKANIAAVKGVV